MTERVKLTMKRTCYGCPYAYGEEATEMAYNLGCLPDPFEIRDVCDASGTAWACHSAPETVCAGYAEVHPERAGLPIHHMEGVHSTGRATLKAQEIE